jgi:hypothetical protein
MAVPRPLHSLLFASMGGAAVDNIVSFALVGGGMVGLDGLWDFGDAAAVVSDDAGGGGGGGNLDGFGGCQMGAL